jgi:hypothetical protein
MGDGATCPLLQPLSRLADARLAAAGRFWLSDIEPRANVEHARIVLGQQRLENFGAF